MGVAYVLILVSMYPNPHGISMQEFGNREACYTAAKEVAKAAPKMNIICVPKS